MKRRLMGRTTYLLSEGDRAHRLALGTCPEHRSIAGHPCHRYRDVGPGEVVQTGSHSFRLRPFRSSIVVVLVVATILVTATALAGEGRIEINQETVNAAGGFPYMINAPGSYVLTGPLVVPASTDGLIFAVDGIVLDLNGFSITGPATCVTGSCASGPGSAIAPFNLFFGADKSTVRNGAIRGFANVCVRLLNDALVENLQVSECGASGISVFDRSLVNRNRVLQTGQSGISMTASGLYAHNSVAQSGLAGGGEPAITGGHPSAGNSCEDGSCSSDRRRRYYLTDRFSGQTYTGSQATTACVAGFRMASIDELSNRHDLRYDFGLGETSSSASWDQDEKSGPPKNSRGWARTLWASSAMAVAGIANCAYWTTDDAGSSGTLLFFSTSSAEPVFTQGLESESCNVPSAVWCIEN